MLVANLKRCSRAPLVYSPAGLSPPFRNRAVVFFMYHPLLNWRLWREVSRGYRFVPIREIREEPPIAQLVLGRWFSLADPRSLLSQILPFSGCSMYTENSRGWRGGQVFMFYFKLKSRSGRFLAGPVFLLLAFEPAHAQAPQGSSPQSSSAPQSSTSSSQDSSSQDSQNDRSSLGIPELPQGLRIVSASIFGSYYSSGVPNTSATSFNYANANLLGSDEAYGGTANVIYIKQRARDSFSLHY